MNRIGEFRIIAEIHCGAISRVFRAYQPSLDRVVLVKTLHGRWTGEEDLVRRFEQEARAAARLNHPNIVAVHAYGTEGDIPYIAMEFVEGETVGDLLSTRGALPIGVAVHIAREVCAGLEAAHGRGILHRDIKPSNILISADGDVKIGDFGLAALFEVTRWEAEDAAGTPSYMAPEQLRGESLSGRTDLFSLGATLYEMVTGERAFGGRIPGECLQSVLRGDPPAPERFRPDLPAPLSRIIMETLAGDPEARPAEAASLRKGLDAFRESHRLRIGREEMAGYLRGEAPPAATAPAVDPDVREEPPGARRRRVPLLAALLLAAAVGIAGLFRRAEEDRSAAALPGPKGGPLIARGTDAPAEADIRDTLPVPGDEGSPPGPAEARSVTDRRPVTDTPDRGAAPHVDAPAPGPSVSALDIQCTPWAVVFVDGDSVDTTPIKRPIPLSAGTHLLELRNPAFPAIRREITVGPDDTLGLRLSFWDHVGRLHVTARPWARIYIDGTYAETTPVRGPIVLTPGSHHLSFEHPALEPMEEEIEITGGEEIRLTLDLEKRLQERK